MQTQKQRPGEDVDSWVIFFLDCLNKISGQLLDKFSNQGNVAGLGVKEKSVYLFVESHPGSRSGEIASRLELGLPLVKKILAKLVVEKLIVKHGAGAGTNYTV